MSLTGLPAFDETVHLTNGWLKDVMAQLGSEDRHYAYLALRATLHALRDRLPRDSAAHLASQLPMLVRGFFYDGWKPSAPPTQERHASEFFAHVREAMQREMQADPEAMVRAVFTVLARRLSEGEVRKVIGLLPPELRALWPEEARPD